MRIITTQGELNESAIRPTKPVSGAGLVEKTATPLVTHATSAANVRLSARAHELAKQSSDHADASKVDALRASIQDGTFHIDRQALAKRIVDGG